MLVRKLIRALWRVPQRPSVLLLAPVLVFADACLVRHGGGPTPHTSWTHKIAPDLPLRWRRPFITAIHCGGRSDPVNTYTVARQPDGALTFRRNRWDDSTSSGPNHFLMSVRMNANARTVGPWSGALEQHHVSAFVYDDATNKMAPNELVTILNRLARHLDQSGLPADPQGLPRPNSQHQRSDADNGRILARVLAENTPPVRSGMGQMLRPRPDHTPRWRGVAHTGAATSLAGAWVLSLATTPLWFGASWLSPRGLIKQRRRRRGLCPTCAYDLQGLEQCPECGALNPAKTPPDPSPS